MDSQLLDAEKIALRDRVKRLEADLEQLSRFDTLSGMLNRLAFLAEIDKHIAQIAQTEKIGTVIKLTVAHSVEMPEVKGQHVDDFVMTHLAHRLGGMQLPHHFVGRIESNCLALLFPYLKSGAEAVVLVKQLLASLGLPLDWQKQQLPLDIHAGIVMFSDVETNSDLVLHHASLALPTSLNNGSPAFAFYNADIAAKSKRRNEIVTALKMALAENYFWIAYQAIIDAENSTLVGFEALLRLSHPVLGEIGPLEFIPIAEDTGLIVDIGAWVLESACRYAKEWPDHVNLLVNISPEQLYQGTVVRHLQRALVLAELPACRVEIEITESAFLQDSETVVTQLKTLSKMGCQIVLDDLGTGYSNLSYLWKFPFSKVKIDRSFIAAMIDNAMARTVIQSIISLANDLSLKMTAEGVETLEQAAALRMSGVHYLQGFYFSVPVPEVELASILIKFSSPGPQIAPIKKLATG